MTTDRIFVSFNPRKAKFGFRTVVALDYLEAIAKAKTTMDSLDPDAIMELNFNMGANEFKIYTNSQAAADYFGGIFVAGTFV